MRKVFSALSASVMLAASMVALSSGAANADPYPGFINTNCFASAANTPRVPKAAKVDFRVGTEGNGAADGNVTFSYERRGNGVIVKVFQRDYQGPGQDRYSFKKVPKGTYVVRVHFDSQPGDSVYEDCHTNFKQKVRARGKHG